MYLRHLQYLRAVIEQGSFAAAARACGVSQPAISHGMRVLQDRFDAPLLARDGRRYVPTDLALRVASESRSVAERIDALLPGTAPAAALARGSPSVLRAGLTSSAAIVCGPVLYRGWCAGHPRRSLELVSADEGRLLAGLLEQRLDIAIAPRPRGFAHHGIVQRRLYALRPLVYARRGHPLARARSLEDLRGAAWARVEPSVSGPVDVLTEAHRVRQLRPPRVAARCPDFASMLQMVAATDLLAVVPHPVLAGGAAALLSPLRLREALPLYDMWLFEPARRPSKLPAGLRRQLQDLGDAVP
ncbi:LysR family transcriptional regulator [Paracidovorax anthurii]|uniref:DNA-binding transcriptional LysR family regulator n=1 Tax=Paracidovorax anthurii TaxID=78229 RepID=A0A328Z615_9BURK|nr:LysR family transcriptional regulator [Paracidovorax anthurii]RAR77686.1 DNA-binding transcriptional LysR family regulator [Paracidovorax anthurii]